MMIYIYLKLQCAFFFLECFLKTFPLSVPNYKETTKDVWVFVTFYTNILCKSDFFPRRISVWCLLDFFDSEMIWFFITTSNDLISDFV